MKKIVSISEVVDTFELDSKEYRVYAAGEAEYDEAKGELIVKLNSFVQPHNPPLLPNLSRPLWRRNSQVVRSIVSLEEAGSAAKEIFHSWARKLTHAGAAMSTA